MNFLTHFQIALELLNYNDFILFNSFNGYDSNRTIATELYTGANDFNEYMEK